MVALRQDDFVPLVQSRVCKNWQFSYDNSQEHLSLFQPVVDDVIDIFSQYVPTSNKRNMKITIWNNDYPMYSNDHENIFLDPTGPSYWSQIVYQLAHELCHFSILDGIKPQDYKWFEETLGELSSLFFLKRMGELWKSSVVPEQKHYYYSFVDYAEKTARSIEKVPLNKAGDGISQLSKYLAVHDTDRNINRYIALKLLPIFEKSPKIWQSVPLLRTIQMADNFVCYLREWQRISNPEGKAAIQKIIHQFE